MDENKKEGEDRGDEGKGKRFRHSPLTRFEVGKIPDIKPRSRRDEALNL